MKRVGFLLAAAFVGIGASGCATGSGGVALQGPSFALQGTAERERADFYSCAMSQLKSLHYQIASNDQVAGQVSGVKSAPDSRTADAISVTIVQDQAGKPIVVRASGESYSAKAGGGKEFSAPTKDVQADVRTILSGCRVENLQASGSR